MMRLALALLLCLTFTASAVAAPAVPEEAAQRLVDLSACVSHLEQTGNLVRVVSEVDPEYELAGIAKKYEGKKCILFEHVKGSEYPVFMGLLWNRNIVGDLFGVSKEQVPFVIASAIGPWHRNKDAFPSPILEKGPANEVVEPEVDLYKLPVPVHALKDGGRYLDSSVVVVKNPETGIPNISIHRIMITGKDRLTFLIDPGRHLGAYLEIMEKRNEPLEVTINNGVGLAPWIVSAIPRQGRRQVRHRQSVGGTAHQFHQGANRGRAGLRGRSIRHRSRNPSQRPRGGRSLRGSDRILCRTGQTLGHEGEGDHAP